MSDIPRRPVGNDAEANFDQRVHEEAFSGKNDTISGQGIRVSRTTRGRKIQIVTTPGRGIKDDWTDPIVLDVTKPVKKGQEMVLTPLHSLVTTGLVDIGTNTLKKSYPGKWKATRDVPAKDGNNKYHVPQWPLPPLFNPLLDDPDDENVFWFLESPYLQIETVCSDGKNYIVPIQKVIP